jgi:hypothetical protein
MAQDNKYFADTARIIGSFFYGKSFAVEQLASYNNHVFRLKFEDWDEEGLPKKDKVLKIGKYGDDDIALCEQRVFRSLNSLGFEVPPIEYSQENMFYEGLIYFTTPWFPNRSLHEIYLDDPEKAFHTLIRIGNFTRRLSDLQAVLVEGALNAEEGRNREIETWANALDIFEQYRESLNPMVFNWMWEAREILDRDYTSFIHRDGPQVLTDGGRHFSVVDWSLAGAGHPLRSLGIKIGEYLIWMEEPLRSQDWRNWLLNGFFGDSTIGWDTKKELRLMTIYYMLLVARSNLLSGNHGEARRIIRLIEEENERNSL